MNGNQNKRIDTRNRKREMISSSGSRSGFIEKNEENLEEIENISCVDIEENKNIIIQKKKNLKFVKQKEEDINSNSSKRGSENKLLLGKNLNFKNYLKKKDFEKYKLDFTNEIKNKTDMFIYNEKKLNKDAIKNINHKETENYLYSEEDIKNNKINFKKVIEEEEENEDNKENNYEEIFNLIIGYNFEKIIEQEYIKSFFFASVPEERTLSMNVNKIKKTENKTSNLDFQYNLEIVRNNKIYFFAKIKQSFPSSNIKIYIKSFNNEYIKVGKIISNILKNDFTIYKGNKKTNYEKILKIAYEINFFGNKVRKMVVEKFENNRIKYTLCNDTPEWDVFYKTYKLNFNGRVKQKSKKNFILKYKDIIDKENENEKLLQCGKIDDNCYALDFISPLSPFEAFSISITSIINKISFG